MDIDTITENGVGVSEKTVTASSASAIASQTLENHSELAGATGPAAEKAGPAAMQKEENLTTAQVTSTPPSSASPLLLHTIREQTGSEMSPTMSIVPNTPVTTNRERTHTGMTNHSTTSSNNIVYISKNRNTPRSDVQNGSLRWYSHLHNALWTHPVTFKELSPLIASFVAFVLTGWGGYDCSYFHGARISFTGSNYGIWSLEDLNGQCKLWDTLFFAYDLGGHLIAARVFSMTSLLLGMGVFVTMVQALQVHLIAWSVGNLFVVLLLISLATTSFWNVWLCFWLFTYVVMNIIVRALFIHPYYRRISQNGNNILAFVSFLAGTASLLTLIALRSDFCTCDSLSSERFEGRDPGEKACEGNCSLGAAGYVSVLSGAAWMVTAVFVVSVGVQPKRIFEYHRDKMTDSWESANSAEAERVMNGDQTQTQPWEDTLSSPVAPTARPRAIGYHSRETSITTRVVNAAQGFNGILRQSMSFGSNNGGGDPKRRNNSKEDVEPPLSEDDRAVQVDQEEELDEYRIKQTCCQRLCCDLRITPRTRQEKILFWSFRIFLGWIFGMYIFILIVLIGSRSENTRAAKAPSTTPAFITPKVCAWNPLDPSEPFQTFDDKDEAVASGRLVAHCGECGVCSNPLDIQTYVYTRKTIAETAKSCKMHVFFGDPDELTDCLMNKIGFQRDCAGCWADNSKYRFCKCIDCSIVNNAYFFLIHLPVINTAEYCLFTCIKTLFTGFMSNNNVPGAGDTGWLNQCLFCDEKMSGPEFVRCSGVARRRLGIVSEIERNPMEQCLRNDIDWLNVDWEETFGIPSFPQ